MKNIKKILFPFFKENHLFLLEKWWFRLIIVFYVLFFAIVPLVVFNFYVNGASNWCYNSLYFYYSSNDFNHQLAICSQLVKESWPPYLIGTLIGTIIVHYLIQVSFFKIIINFIFLRGKNKTI